MESVVLATGGTGGHIFPAIAVAEEIRARNPGCLIVFIGSTYGPEADIVAKAGFDFVGLPVRGVVGRGLRGIFSLLGLGGGVLKSLRILKKVKPQFVLGFGGYAAFAGVTAAWLQGRLCGVHEQNAFPGRANRLLGTFVSRVFLSFPVEMGFPERKKLLVGNPVRACVKEVPAERARIEESAAGAQKDTRAPRLLVMGGSLGAVALNKAVMEGVRPLLDAGIEIWHQTGSASYAEVRAAYRAAGAEHVRVEAFVDDMKAAYAWADLALCRAGGTSIAELAVAGMPSVLVPFPFATHDHQLYNAKFLEQVGAALVLEQKEFAGAGNSGALVKVLTSLIRDRERLMEMRRQCLLHAKPNAAASIVDEMEILLSLKMINE